MQIAAWMALWAGAVQQNPVVVQCPTPAVESWVKWLLPTIVQTVVSLASIGTGVGIAVWSFGKNFRAQHKQWIRDKRKEEWSALMLGLTNAYKNFSHFSENKVDGLLKNEALILRTLDEVSMPFIFIAEDLRRIDYYPRLRTFQNHVQQCCAEIKNCKIQYKANPDLSLTCMLKNKIENLFYPLEQRFFDLLRETQEFAKADVYDEFRKSSLRERVRAWWHSEAK